MTRHRTSKDDIHRIVGEKVHHLYFSKCCARFFKKVSELAILHDAEVATVVFSPSGKAISFGHPSMEAILERFAPTGAGAIGVGGTGTGEDIKQVKELTHQYRELRALLKAEKARKERAVAAIAKERVAGNPVVAWLEADICDLGEEELMAYAAALKEVLAAVDARANQVLQDSLNHGRAMAARDCSFNNNQVQPMPPLQQFLANNETRFVDQFGAGSANNNDAEIEMQIQQMMMMARTPPPPGFAATGIERLLQQGFGFPNPY